MQGTRTTYSFPHLSIQEFLAAWFVSRHPDLVDKTIAQSFNASEKDNYQPEVKSHLHAFVRFLAGMVGCNKFPIKFKPIVIDKRIKHLEIGKPEYFLSCFYEAQDTDYLNALPENASWDIKFYPHSPPIDMYTFGYTLVHAPIRWELCPHAHDCGMLVRSLADNAPTNSSNNGKHRRNMVASR